MLLLAIYLTAAFLTPPLINLGVLPDGQQGLGSPMYASPSWDHWCGTDRLGRDVCVRTLQGTGVALQVVLLAVGLAVLIGVPMGILSGYIGGFVDRIMVLIMETLYTVPVLLLAVVIAFVLGRGIVNAAIALCVVYIPQYFRVVRNQTEQVKTELYIESAKAMGAGPVWIMRKYLLKNVITSLPVLLTLNAADGVLVLGGLGFLGLGLPETIPEWGSDLNLALDAVPIGIWWTALYPGMAMFGLVFSLSLIGEALEDFIEKSQLNEP
ncbi:MULTISPECIES: ABC transporter permease [unclassified Prochlorococcus]|uniref:ABC transporter permease n=1 Tax=unclassified Prochlorococcus TaxID=2627481 RepID=UPI000533A926|nr:MULTISPECIES: ABC transporter permease [unclassified Prochlorococcus]KGG16539.1 ABC-type peptide transporter permease component [Prochlorococcus sp. MIT 0602]KGG16986.1 Dipeptide transport system permease protein DppC [Prochlorococcus sp. MIT 0603]